MFHRMHSPETVRRYTAIYRAREAARKAADASRAADLLARLPAIASVLQAEFGAHRVGFFGSLARGGFSDGSDLDLYVDLVRVGGYFHALDRVCRMAGLSVDLVEYESAPASLRATIDRDGRDVHAG